MRPTDKDDTSTRRATDVFSHARNVVDLRRVERAADDERRTFALLDSRAYDLAADDADLEFLLKGPADPSERTTIRRRRIRWERLWLRVATVAWAFSFGVVIAIGGDVVMFIMLGVALACAFVVVEH